LRVSPLYLILISAKISLKNRDKSIHKTALADIERLQNKIFVG
jgi:hypothetical protein